MEPTSEERAQEAGLIREEVRKGETRALRVELRVA